MKDSDRSRKNKTKRTCYLCGQTLNGNINNDHVPPRQFYAELLRKHYNLNLLTLPTHAGCNKAYQNDEDYFVTSIGPLVMAASVAGKALWRDLSKKIKRPENVALAAMAGKEFHETYNGIYLPNNKIAKKFNPDRVWGIIWKITRGLFYFETGRYLPLNTPHHFMSALEVKGDPPSEFQLLNGQPSRGKYQAVFDYKYLVDNNLNNFNVWAMLLWDSLIMMVAFHDPACSCNHCIKVRG